MNCSRKTLHVLDAWQGSEYVSALSQFFFPSRSATFCRDVSKFLLIRMGMEWLSVLRTNLQLIVGRMPRKVLLKDFQNKQLIYCYCLCSTSLFRKGRTATGLLRFICEYMISFLKLSMITGRSGGAWIVHEHEGSMRKIDSKSSWRILGSSDDDAP